MYKYYEISDENVDFIKRIKAEKNFTSEKTAINYIIDGFRNHYRGSENTYQDELAAAIINKFNEQYGQSMTRLLSSMIKSEEMLQTVQDAMNTMLMREGIETCVLTDVMPSPVIERSKEYYKHRLSEAKQRRDNSGKK